MKTIKILDMEITPIEEYTGRYCNIKVPKGFRLIKRWELMKILDSDQADDFLGKFKGQWNWFWCAQSWRDERNNRASRLCLSGDLYVGASSGDLAISGDGGRVVFAKIFTGKEGKT